MSPGDRQRREPCAGAISAAEAEPPASSSPCRRPACACGRRWLLDLLRADNPTMRPNRKKLTPLQLKTLALARKGLLRGGRAGRPILTAEGLAYETGVAAAILHGADHRKVPAD